MTLEEIDAALVAVPASPVTPEDIETRANLMLKRYELQAAARQADACRAAADCKHGWGLPLVNVPGDINCVIINSRTVIADMVDNHRVMRLTRDEVAVLATGNTEWTTLNTHLVG